MKKPKSDHRQVSFFDAGLADDVLGHGGKREGAGRHKKRPKKVMRISEDIADLIKQIDENTEDRTQLIENLKKLS